MSVIKPIPGLLNIFEKDGTAVFTVRVVPRASRSEIAGSLDGSLKVRIASPPVDGAANAELIRLLAKTLGLPKGNIDIFSGQTSKTKQVRVEGVTAEQLRDILSLARGDQ